ncbi:MAG: hypothetical protein ABSF35_18515 [Polyangia bacterium]
MSTTSGFHRAHNLRRSTVRLSVYVAASTSLAAIAQDQPAAPPTGAAPAPEVAPAPQYVPDRAASPVWTPGGYPDEYILRPLTVPPGMFQGTVPVVLNLSKGAVFKPVWLPLDMRFGMTEQFELFLSGNDLGAPTAVGHGGICLGRARYCPNWYNNLNLGGHYSFLKRGTLELSGFVVAEFKQFTPDTLFAIDAGVAVKYVAGVFSVKTAPRIGVGAYRRSARNAEGMGVPIQIAIQAKPEIAIFLDTGVFASMNQFGGTWQVPLGIGADLFVRHGVDVGAEFMLPALGAGSAVTPKAADSRTLMLYAVWRSP